VVCCVTLPDETKRSESLLMSHREPSINAARSPAACPARVYEYWLGGSYHGPADREAAEEVISCHPQVVANVRATRAFSRRVAWYAANGCSIRQFLDIGAGLPGPDATHETVRRASPGCRIAYADNDPLVAEHARGQIGTGSCAARK
jgi:S-adenosyl methyltransferase